MPLKEGAINEILPFAPEGIVDAGDVLSLEEYKKHPMRLRGHMVGLALRELQNREARQSTHMAAGLAQFIANRYVPGVVDDGNLDKVEEGLSQAIENRAVPYPYSENTPYSKGQLCLDNSGTIWQAIQPSGPGTDVGPIPTNDTDYWKLFGNNFTAFVQSIRSKTSIYENPGIYTYSPAASLMYAIVKVQGAGGGGGGAAASGTAEGGAGGSYCEKLFTASELTSDIILTVGEGGAPGAAGRNAGKPGGTSSFGTIMTAFGGVAGNGSGGAPNPSYVGRPNVQASAPVGGDINLFGGIPSHGHYMMGNNSVHGIFGGDGGASPIGGVGGDAYYQSYPAKWGAGGGGANGGSGIAKAGLKGGDGVIIIQEVYLVEL